MRRMKKTVAIMLLSALIVLSVLPGLGLAAASGAPGAPLLYQSNWNNSPNYSIGFNMWWGNNGTAWKLYENNVVVHTGTLIDQSPNAQTASFAFTNKPSGTYVYKVELINSYGSSTSGTISYQVINASGGGDSQAPSVPGNLAASDITENSVKLSWNASTDNVGVTGYEVYQGGSLAATVAGTSYTATALTAGTAYTYTVKARDAAGNVSAASLPLVVTTLAVTPDTTAPSAPANLTASNVTSSSVSLEWAASTDDVGVTGYTVNYGSTSVSVSGTSTTIAGLASGTSYTFVVTAKDAAGNVSAASNSVVVTTLAVVPDTTAPSAPANLTASSVTSSSVALTWAASTDNVGVTGYTVSYGSTDVSVTGTSATISGLTPNTSYTFVVKAKDAAGNVSAASNAVTVLTETAPVNQDACRPEGLYDSGVEGVPYCSAYDTDGRELLPNGLDRRIIGYFTSWRTGDNGQLRYLASDIPWNKLSHINYAFAHIDSNNKVSVGSHSPNNASLGKTWPGVAGAEMDPSYSYQGHFNLLNKFKKQNPGVKTLISVGGWAETGGYFNDNGDRVANGGFYTMTTNADGSVNEAGIEAFSDSAVAFIRQYGFDGVDIDYEYPTSMKDAGNPHDWVFSTPRLAGLAKSYDVLMKTLRTKLDQASAEDGQYYMLTIASPSSGYLLRGMETFNSLKYLDYVNVMSYDLHGAWNEFVGPNAQLFDDGKDAELKAAGVYSTAEYGGIGYLNTDWAYHYMRGMMQAGRINIGVPYYTRGFQNVVGGTNGLWGTAKGTVCPTELKGKCGDGAVGIDNLWHDKNDSGHELGAGSNPMWHAKNLEFGIRGTYLGDYGLEAAPLTGTYTRHYDETLVAPWLWNSTKRVFISTEDEQSINAKADWAIENSIGGLMIWELAGDYGWDAGKSEYGVGYTMTNAMYNKFSNTTPYGNTNRTIAMPAEKFDASIEFTGFKLGDQNFPINPKIKLTNNSNTTITGGAVIEFDVPTSTNALFRSWNGDQVSVISTGHTGNNIGGLKGDFHRIAITVPGWKSIAPGASELFDLVYYLPISGPANVTITIDGVTYSLNP
ncbi:chitinase [Paenibacillus pinisoli]|uniref:Chitinase n=1 Tax=Paenibacillus pinisoli TaxID=1276110 RepID=A0A3A6PP53_9BACL|nr:glycosyl hydrolase family 18 protein [Paenibacillus pinisoli]RJX39979.1 chitinase [Paenibacillus pinisoli]